jgi:hypothetical protein
VIDTFFLLARAFSGPIYRCPDILNKIRSATSPTGGPLREYFSTDEEVPAVAGRLEKKGSSARQNRSRQSLRVFRSLAARVRAFAAAFEALVALSLRCLAVRALARARPPRLPISDMTFEI